MALRVRAIAAAQGREPFDVLIAGGTVVDVGTLELREADIGLVGEMIASVHPRGRFRDAARVHDAGGLYVAPGFIDGHVHFESSHMLPHHYAEVVVPQGTTTIFCDPHELANVLGVEGLRWAVRATRDLPLRCIVQASSCVPAAPGLETSGADFQAPEIRELLSWPEVAGLAEVMDMRAVLEASPRMVGILAEALASGKIIEGHARGLSAESLQAYLAAGISADHELVSGDDALEKLRAGMTVELRGSHDHLLPGIVQALHSLPVIPARLTVCTDDVFPDYLVEHGGVNDVLRRLIRYGMDPLQAIRCATINNAMRLRREDLGMVCAGRRADLVLMQDLREMRPEHVYTDGRHTAAEGRMLHAVPAPPIEMPTRTMKVGRFSPDDFRVRVPDLPNGRAVLRAIKGARFTSWSEVEVEVRDGVAVVPPGCSVMSVIHRHGRNPAAPQTAIIEGWGAIAGGYASSYSHDSHNLVVYGGGAEDMALAANAVAEMGGGDAVAHRGRITATIAYPVAGLLSALSPQDVAREHREVVRAAGEIIEWQAPYRVFKALEGQCLACNPGPHLTDCGLTDGTTRKIFGSFLRAA
jgi:adenine deaminase